MKSSEAVQLARPKIMVNIVSSSALEPWDWTNPWTKGIGGSEQSHIEMAARMAARGISVTSYAPVPWGGYRDHLGPNNVPWWHYSNLAKHLTAEECPPSVLINYRNPVIFDYPKAPGSKWWFVAQDVDYEGAWTEERFSKVDRYICLCKKHVNYTLDRYPFLKDRIYISSNGVRSWYIGQFERDNAITRVPYRMLYASSPDRGLLFLLENWFRIRERFPKAELRVAYGFDNMDVIVDKLGFKDHRIELRENLKNLLKQDGITFLGRLPMNELYKEWFSASVFPYPSDWPETSCVSIMDAMACGAIPVTTNYWAQGQHSKAHDLPYVVDGLPQKSDVVKSIWLNELYKALALTSVDSPSRTDMMRWARDSFDWSNVVDQWEGWVKEDLS